MWAGKRYTIQNQINSGDFLDLAEPEPHSETGPGGTGSREGTAALNLGFAASVGGCPHICQAHSPGFLPKERRKERSSEERREEGEGGEEEERGRRTSLRPQHHVQHRESS